MNTRSVFKDKNIKYSPQQQHILDLQLQHRKLLDMSQRRASSPDVNATPICCPPSILHPRTEVMAEALSNTSGPTVDLQPFRNLNPYLKPKRSNSLHNCRKNFSRKTKLPSRSNSYDNEDHFYHEIDFTPRPSKTCGSTRNIFGQTSTKINVTTNNFLPQKSKKILPLRKRSNMTYPPYPAAPQPVVKRRLFTSLILDTFNGFRWDEDPCLWRPQSPGLTCPHDPRGKSDESLNAGSCFVVGPPMNCDDCKLDQTTLENPYSYAGEGIVAPADAIRSPLDSDSYMESIASENIYEEIPDEWEAFKTNNRRSLIEEVFDEYERVRARRIHSSPDTRLVSKQKSGSIVTLDFSFFDSSASPDSGLNLSMTGTEPPIYDDVGPPTAMIRRGSHPGFNASHFPNILSVDSQEKPPIPKLKRCETLESNNFPSRLVNFRLRSGLKSFRKKSASKDHGGDRIDGTEKNNPAPAIGLRVEGSDSKGERLEPGSSTEQNVESGDNISAVEEREWSARGVGDAKRTKFSVGCGGDGRIGDKDRENGSGDSGTEGGIGATDRRKWSAGSGGDGGIGATDSRKWSADISGCISETESLDGLKEIESCKGEGVKKEGYLRGHLRSSGRGIRNTFDGVREKIEGQGRKFLFNIKKGN
ncbi:uncharacterized protein LOC125178108 [Hyalella azteca]|uniref:Uncharacterized protein LOC125178108 n=1 Tax=Hyalella azteca TaxID=294128 RepID=A0A979FK59_HYAAZ|nr:uncharacterized protein LOC125178108 [Hyalella azteca]